jgi:hypothetical protein
MGIPFITMLPSAGAMPDRRGSFCAGVVLDRVHLKEMEGAAAKFQTITQLRCISAHGGAFCFLRKGGALQTVQSLLI